MTKKETSDFGDGFIYNLILFAEHFGRIEDEISQARALGGRDDMAVMLWCNVASDHLRDIKFPSKFLGTDMEKKFWELRDYVLDRRGLEKIRLCKIKDFEVIKRMTKNLGLLIDKEFGIKVEKAEYE